MRHQDARGGRDSALHGVFGFCSGFFRPKCQTGGPGPKDLSIGTASRHQNQHLHRLLGTMSVRAHMPICRSAKLAAARRRLERAAQYTPTVSCLCPSQVVVARSRELAIRERRQPIKGLCRSPPRRGDLVAVAGDARVPALVTVPRRPLPRARKAAQRQPGCQGVK